MRLSPAAVLLLLILPLASAVTAQDENSSRLSILDPKGREVGWYGGSYAILLGASDYTAGWPDLPNVPRELAEVRKELEAHGFEIVATHTNATVRVLKKNLQSFFETYGGRRSNRLLVFFSGHGYSFEGDERGYLVPVDAPDPLVDRPGFLRKTLHMSRVMAWSRNIRPAHVLFLFDSCVSAYVFQGSTNPDSSPEISDKTLKPVRQYISACGAGEKMPEKSVFAPHLARALRGDADLNEDLYLTGSELSMFLREGMSGARSGQTLQYAKIRDPDLHEGDLVFRLSRKRYEWLGVGTAQEPFIGPAPVGPTASRLLGVKSRNPRAGAAVEIVADGALAYSTFRLDNPLRFVIDLPGVVNKAGALTVPINAGGLRQVRIAQFKMSPTPIARVVFDMSSWAPPKIKTRKDGFYVRFPPPDQTGKN